MERSLAELEAVVRDRICGVCTERTVAGECGMDDQNDCALFRLFPEVARAIQSVESNDITEYIDAIRHRVCSICVEQAADGSCATREQVRCALDAYLLLVVDAIEEATGKSFDRARISNPGAPGVGINPALR